MPVAAGEVIVALPEPAATGERFIPVTRFALIDRLTRPHSWPDTQVANDARRFFRYLDFWRRQRYAAQLLSLEQDYEPFNPDSDLLITRKIGPADRLVMQKRLVKNMATLLEQANFERIDVKQVQLILTRDSHYGLDLFVDLDAFEEILIYYRGATNTRHSRRSLRKLFLHKEEFDVPIYQRLFILFKLKPEADRVREVMEREKCTEKEALRQVRRLRGRLPAAVKPENVYLKLFKNIPRTDIEMVFPNTKVRFRIRDKIKLGVTAGGGTVAGIVGTVTKLMAATNPVGLAVAVAGFGGLLFRQIMSFFQQHQRYMVVMAQNLYFHSMADNHGVMTLLADRAVAEDVKEEILLYSVLAKESVKKADFNEVKVAIEQYLINAFGAEVHFDLHDALERLERDGLISETPDGALVAMPPAEAAKRIDQLWDSYLDELPDPKPGEGFEYDDDAPLPTTPGVTPTPDSTPTPAA
ncbi:MAG: TMEM143 family protein [Hyphomicrobiaceae bacterium]